MNLDICITRGTNHHNQIASHLISTQLKEIDTANVGYGGAQNPEIRVV